MQIFAIVVAAALTLAAVILVVGAVRQMLSVIRAGQPAIGRTDDPGRRWKNMAVETLGHTRMLQWNWIGVMHWFVLVGFIYLSSLVATAYLQVFFGPDTVLPVIGHFPPFEWVAELLGWLTLIGILFLIVVRQRFHPKKRERDSRFFGSNFWQAYFVEAIILGEAFAGILIRGLEYAKYVNTGSEYASATHFPMTAWFGQWFTGLSVGTLETLIICVALSKIVMATVWAIVISRNITMGVAWHRFTAWFNIWFKRESDGGTALGAMKPLYINGEALNMEMLEDLEEEDFEKLGTGKVEDFSWKGLLDFTTCTECGRCQSQCPAWNTEKPLSPKLLVMGLRDHAYAKVPLLEKDPETLTEEEQAELERPLIGDESAYGVIDPDVLWSCTNCGACVQQCPVDIEHVDHIEDMRRYQVLVESNFPTELNNIFKGLERKGNPWNMNPRDRMDWAKNLDFEVKQVGTDVESLDDVEWLFWVGCAGAYEDRAKKTTQAVAELLNIAGVDFAVLGDGETCTGDSARRAGNEVLFAQLAMENAMTLNETNAKKVVSTCAHCFNTLKNEYAEFGVELEVVHHTQLLNRLVREKRLTPVAAPSNEAAGRKITYHDPCFLGRHNQVYEAPRELLTVIPGAEFTEMPRNAERSFCCGAGGARMWMEETLGSRININRTEEAVATGADRIAVGCPFCRVMLSDGLTAKQSEGEAREEVEVSDVAQLLLDAVKRSEVEDEVVAEAETVTAGAAAGTTAAVAGESGSDESTKPSAEAKEVADELNKPDTTAAEGEQFAADQNIEVDPKTGAQGSSEDSEPESEEPAAEPDPEVEAEREKKAATEVAPPIEPSSTPEVQEPDEDDEAAEAAGEPASTGTEDDENLGADGPAPIAELQAEGQTEETPEALPDVDAQQPRSEDDQIAEWKDEGGAPPPEGGTESNG